MKEFIQGTLIVLAALLAFLFGVVVVLRFSPSPEETQCQEIPRGTVILAPAFLNLGKDPSTGRYVPGAANERIAQKLEECADRFTLVLTQQAVSDALNDAEHLQDGTPVHQMHQDNSYNVGTLEAMQCAIERLEESSYPQKMTIGLVAHDKHLARSRRALKAVLRSRFPDATIIDLHLGTTPFEDTAWHRPWGWAGNELWKRPAQFVQVQIGHVCGFDCSALVKISEELPEP